ncbi:MAG TPA: hypothetical protein VNU19_07155, partial [Candidatus Acidoferrum sp.]|nr:hypothetical protein [Candidatus Acidoferrum sp.]
RTAYKRHWRSVRRTKNAEGQVISRVQIPVSDSPIVHPMNPSLARVSTLYDAEGNVRAQWQIEKPEDRARALLMQEALDVLSQRLVPLDPIPASPASSYDELVGYPIGDHHLGMLSWRPETGAHYDLEIGERLLRRAFVNLVQRSPATYTALIVVLGDFQHYDSVVPQTTSGRHILDTDSRHRKMVRVALRTLVSCIEVVLTQHQTVRVIVEPGNHDEYSAGWLTEALALRYASNGRIGIDTTPGRFHYFRFGKVLIGSHHGDTVKDPAHLPGIMAADRAEDWGATEHRMWWTGHKHSQSFRSFPGATVECFNILPPADAWAHATGYRPQREMHALVLNSKTGYRGRAVVTPQMLGE